MLSSKHWRSCHRDITSRNILLHIKPLFPHFLCRYAWANLFILPGTVLFCFLGATAGSLADSGASGDSGVVTIVTIVVGVVFGVLAIVVVSFYAKKELNKVCEITRPLFLCIVLEEGFHILYASCLADAFFLSLSLRICRFLKSKMKIILPQHQRVTALEMKGTLRLDMQKK